MRDIALLQEIKEFLTDPDNEESLHENVTGDSLSFDKFMDQIILQETSQKKLRTVTEEPQRLLASRRQERPLGRTLIRGNQ